MSDNTERVSVHASGGQEVSYRKSPLMKLTQIAYPNMLRETPAYIDPSLIVMVRRVVQKFKSGDRCDDLECTLISLAGAPDLCVTETPDEIATRRDIGVGAR